MGAACGSCAMTPGCRAKGASPFTTTDVAEDVGRKHGAADRMRERGRQRHEGHKLLEVQDSYRQVIAWKHMIVVGLKLTWCYVGCTALPTAPPWLGLAYVAGARGALVCSVASQVPPKLRTQHPQAWSAPLKWTWRACMRSTWSTSSGADLDVQVSATSHGAVM